MSVHVHIEHLLLDGFELTAVGRRQLQNAVEQELALLLAAPHTQPRKVSRAEDSEDKGHISAVHPLAEAAGAVPSAVAGPFKPPRGATPKQLGQQIAQSVHGGLGKRN